MAISEEGRQDNTKNGATDRETPKDSGDGAGQSGCVSTECIIEISDKDYRSFCLPCDVLEEADERKKDN
ncbi:MAG: hypothetical protein ACJ04P_03525 [Halioglobus sp.]